jgi:hypothetical protein
MTQASLVMLLMGVNLFVRNNDLNKALEVLRENNLPFYTLGLIAKSILKRK